MTSGTVASRAIMLVLALGGATACGEILGGVNWADDAHDYSANIQNYAGELLSAATEWWVTGAPDADANHNGVAGDSGDQDTVAGWRAALPGEYLVLHWDTGILDLPGDDLTICYYSGPSAGANVLASVDGDVFELVGTISGGTEGYFHDAVFDFDGRFASEVRYVKVARTASGSQTGMFFDAVGGNVPEPASLTLLAVVALGLRRRHP